MWSMHIHRHIYIYTYKHIHAHICIYAHATVGPGNRAIRGEEEIGEGTHLGKGGKPGGMPPEVSPRRINPSGGGGGAHMDGREPLRPPPPPETGGPFGRGPKGHGGTQAPPTTLDPSMLNC